MRTLRSWIVDKYEGMMDYYRMLPPDEQFITIVLVFAMILILWFAIAIAYWMLNLPPEQLYPELFPKQ